MLELQETQHRVLCQNRMYAAKTEFLGETVRFIPKKQFSGNMFTFSEPNALISLLANVANSANKTHCEVRSSKWGQFSSVELLR